MLATLSGDLIPINVGVTTAAWISAGLLAWMALVYMAMAFGVRSGYLVWSGSHVGRLPTFLRVRSMLYAFGLLVAGLIILELAGVIDLGLIPDRWTLSAGFVVTTFLAVAALTSLVKGSRWERMLFFPITLLGALLVGWVTFV